MNTFPVMNKDVNVWYNQMITDDNLSIKPFCFAPFNLLRHKKMESKNIKLSKNDNYFDLKTSLEIATGRVTTIEEDLMDALLED